MSAFPVFAGGRVQPAQAPVLRAGDEGFLLGLAVFETVLVEDGHPFFLEDHLARLRAGARALSIPWPPSPDPGDALRELVGAVRAERPEERRLALRITLSRGVERRPSLVVTARRVEDPPPEGVRVAVAARRQLSGDPLRSVKSTSRLAYVLAREEARRAGAWEALIVNQEGDVAEGSVSNLFAVRGGELSTPSTGRGCLPGIVREKILAELERDPLVSSDGAPMPVRVDRIELASLGDAAELFLTNTTGGVIPVREVSGCAGGPIALPGADGPVAGLVADRLRTARRRDPDPAGNPAAQGR